MLLVLAAVAAVAAAGAFLWLDALVGRTHADPEQGTIVSLLRETTTTGGDSAAEKPRGQNILALGSDNREEGSEAYGRSDTLMIVHVDPEAGYVSILSLPRDLRVEVPGYGLQKINAAFAYGGPALSIQTVQRVTGIDLDHYVNIDFDAFRAITTTIGGVYVDVDRRYYYAGNQYENIDLQPGYQKLAGEDALDWVRFRHDGNMDFGRIVRQQRFLRAARDQISMWDAAREVPGLVGLLAENVRTDIGTGDALKLAYWGLKLRGSRIKQVDLAADTQEIGGGSYVVATEEAIRDAVRDLLRPPEQVAPAGTGGPAGTAATVPAATTSTTGPPRVDLTGITVEVLNGNGRQGEAAGAAAWLKSMGASVVRVGDAAGHDTALTRVVYPADKLGAAKLVARAVGGAVLTETAAGRITVVLGRDFTLPEAFRPSPTLDQIPDAARWKALAKKVPFRLMAPASLPPGFTYRDSRVYQIETAEGPRPAVKVMYRMAGRDLYMGIMQTTFTDAPAAAEGEAVVIDGTTFTVVSADGKVDRVWWTRDGVLYWVSNTLFYDLDRAQLLAVAASTLPVW
ncbi:MAG: hypothetical protein Kow00122_01140 [Thermoleophilia bacterium]